MQVASAAGDEEAACVQVSGSIVGWLHVGSDIFPDDKFSIFFLIPFAPRAQLTVAAGG